MFVSGLFNILPQKFPVEIQYSTGNPEEYIKDYSYSKYALHNYKIQESATIL